MSDVDDRVGGRDMKKIAPSGGSRLEYIVSSIPPTPTPCTISYLVTKF